MKLEQLELMWKEDTHIDIKNLGEEALKIPVLHQKWYKIYMQERLLLTQIKARIEQMEIILDGFFNKSLTVEELVKYNLSYSDKKFLKPDIPKHIATHPLMIDLRLNHQLQSEKCEFVKDVLKMIHGRSFIIKDAIEWAKYTAGNY